MLSQGSWVIGRSGESLESNCESNSGLVFSLFFEPRGIKYKNHITRDT